MLRGGEKEGTTSHVASSRLSLEEEEMIQEILQEDADEGHKGILKEKREAKGSRQHSPQEAQAVALSPGHSMLDAGWVSADTHALEVVDVEGAGDALEGQKVFEAEDQKARSFALLSPRHPLRRACLTVACSSRATSAFLIANLICCSLLALGPDVFSRGSEGLLADGRNFDSSSIALAIVEYVFFGLLVLEVAVGVGAWGVLGPRGWLLRSHFHVLDAVILCFSVVDLGLRAADGPRLSPVHALRFLRVFKVDVIVAAICLYYLLHMPSTRLVLLYITCVFVSALTL